MESHKRSVVKAVTWRIIAVIVTSTVAYIFTGNSTLSLSIGFVDMAIKLGAYYGHERLWDRSSWGRKKPLEQDYSI